MSNNNTNFVDLDLQKTSDGYYDLHFDSDGDFAKTKGFNTALKMSLLLDARAAASQVADPVKRRGFWGNFMLGFANYELGSLLWLLDQARATQVTLNNAITFTRNALNWLIEDGHLDKINVAADYSSNNTLAVRIDLIRSKNIVQSFGYQIWENTLLELDC
jgi:phage gp46-like protein